MPVIPAIWRLRDENFEFYISLGYAARPCLKRSQFSANHRWEKVTEFQYQAKLWLQTEESGMNAKGRVTGSLYPASHSFIQDRAPATTHASREVLHKFFF
jgi:hypothetical protein